MKFKILYLSILISYIFSACSGSRPYYGKNYTGWQEKQLPDNNKVIYSVFLVGDQGGTPKQAGPVMNMLQNLLQAADTNGAVVFLGDNIYPKGFPVEKNKARRDALERINFQLDAVKNYKGKIYYIPGNHDWEQGRKYGLESLKRQEEYIENYLKRGNVFLPDQGCPGPVEVQLSDDLVLILLDTQWWFHGGDKPSGEKDGCTVLDENDFINLLDDAILRNSEKKILLVGHHPLISNGIHGGFTPPIQTLFPLTAINKSLYVPLPVLGSIYRFYRKHVGNIQDIPNPKYRELSFRMGKVINSQPNIIYAAGHEHNLQYFKCGEQHHVISGSGSRLTYVKRKKEAAFTHSEKGLAKLNYYENGEIWMEMIEVSDTSSNGKIMFRTQIKGKDLPPPPPGKIADTGAYDQKFVVMPAESKFSTGPGTRYWLGDHYRNSWMTPVKVPVVNLDTTFGGLTPLRKGGGKQTKTLKVEGGNGQLYTFRSIKKDPTPVVPKYLRYTIANALVFDQISAAHPYGAFALPKLSNAAGVFHTNPKLYYIAPNAPRLKYYKKDFGGTLVMLEEEPDENWERYPHFGNTKNAVSNNTMIRNLEKDNDNSIDQRAFLRARLFDMLINDWDRHEGQYRWAEFEKEDRGKHYLPIPKDRDQTFFKFDGVIPWWASRKWAIRRFQNFEKDIRDMAGANFNAMHFDRRHLTCLSKKEWIEIADSMKINITDEVIESALRDWPDTIYKIDGAEIKSILMARRDKLDKFALRYYKLLAREVDVVGTNKNEFFEVVRINDDSTSVKVYKISKSGEKDKLIYNRVFSTGETLELRLYGLDGDDEFSVSGNVRRGIKIRIIGGNGDDVIKDQSSVKKGLKRMTVIYDELNNKKVEIGAETKDMRSDDLRINDYRYDGFNYNLLSPVISFGANNDDGLFLGGGALIKTHGFRKNPFATSHRVVINSSVKTGTVFAKYNAEFTQMLKKWDLFFDINLLGPDFKTNFYGLGNETKKTSKESFYEMEFSKFTYFLALKRKFGVSKYLKIGPNYQYYDVNSVPGRFYTSAAAGLNPQDFDTKHFAGFMGEFTINTLDDAVIPKRGVVWRTEGLLNYRFSDRKDKLFSRVASEFSVFFNPNFPFNPVFALRFGAAHNITDYEFFLGNSLGNITPSRENGTLRGFRRDRFWGRTTFYQNSEVRVKLFNFWSYFFPGEFGIIGFVDNGRVWINNVDSRKWHTGYGGGGYFTVLINDNLKSVISATHAISDESQIFNLRIGFFF